MMSDLIVSSPLWSLFLFSLFPLTVKLIRKNKEPSKYKVASLALMGVVISFLCLLQIWPENSKISLALFSETLEFDHFCGLGNIRVCKL